MSKSRGNVVGAIDMAEKYGCDTGRLYTLFAAPPEKDLEWSDQAIEGASRFLQRVYRLVDEFSSLPGSQASGATPQGAARGVPTNAPPSPVSLPEPLSPIEKALLRKAHQTLKRVTAEFDERWHFNSAIALIMDLVNELYKHQPFTSGDPSSVVVRGVMEILVLMLAPIAPHVAEELWEKLGHAGGLQSAGWPAYDEELAREDEFEIPIQINGKVRSRVFVAGGIGDDELRTQALADAKVKSLLDGQTIVKVVIVPNKLVNIVVR